MQTVVMFKCELCGGTYNDAQRAMECENRHVKISKLTDTRFSGKYPRIICAEAEDGTLLKFVRDDS